MAPTSSVLNSAQLRQLVARLEAAVETTSEDLNKVVRQCLVSVEPSLSSLLILSKEGKASRKPASSSKHWDKYKALVKRYVMCIYKVLGSSSNEDIVRVLLKHSYQIVPFIAPFVKANHLYMKKWIELWATASESNRVLAFLSINRFAMISKTDMLDMVIKRMYVAFVKNTKFTSPNTLPLIKFMQKSLAELCARDAKVAYQHAFVYIRQLAIHLRNAITVTKKETCQSVYNWQFIHALSLWTELVCSTYPNPNVQPLIYPLVQVITGTCKLLPTEKYYPLRFHCVRMLNNISRATRTFIPVLPYLLEVLELTDFNKRRQTANQKAYMFPCLLKFSKSQIKDKAFRDGVLEQVYDLVIDTLTVNAHSIAFPELTFPLTMELKKSLKDSKCPTLVKYFKTILQKVEENSTFISRKRREAAFQLSDTKAVDALENNITEAGPPFNKFSASHLKRKQALMMLEKGTDSEDEPKKKRMKR